MRKHYSLNLFLLLTLAGILAFGRTAYGNVMPPVQDGGTPPGPPGYRCEAVAGSNVCAEGTGYGSLTACQAACTNTPGAQHSAYISESCNTQQVCSNIDGAACGPNASCTPRSESACSTYSTCNTGAVNVASAVSAQVGFQVTQDQIVDVNLNSWNGDDNGEAGTAKPYSQGAYYYTCPVDCTSQSNLGPCPGNSVVSGGDEGRASYVYAYGMNALEPNGWNSCDVWGGGTGKPQTTGAEKTGCTRLWHGLVRSRPSGFLQQRGPCRCGVVIDWRCSGPRCALDGQARSVVWIVRCAQAFAGDGACGHAVQEPC
jgi:hypothetical protein